MFKKSPKSKRVGA